VLTFDRRRRHGEFFVYSESDDVGGKVRSCKSGCS